MTLRKAPVSPRSAWSKGKPWQPVVYSHSNPMDTCLAANAAALQLPGNTLLVGGGICEQVSGKHIGALVGKQL